MDTKFFVPLDEKRAIDSKAPIGISTNITKSTFVEVLSNNKTYSTITDVIGQTALNSLNGRNCSFKHSVNPGTVVDLENSYLVYYTYIANVVEGSVVTPANYSVGSMQLLNAHNKVHFSINGTKVMQKGKEFKTAKMIDLYTRYTNKELSQSEFVFQPLFDNMYSNGLHVPTAETTTADSVKMGHIRRRFNNIELFSYHIVKRRVKLSELLFSVGGSYLTNAKTFLLELGFEALNPIVHMPTTAAVSAPIYNLYINDVRLFIKEVDVSSALGSEIISMREKQMSDKIAFIDIMVEDVELKNQITLSSIKNAQFYGITQHAEDVFVNSDDSGIVGSAGQLTFGNAQSTATASAVNSIWNCELTGEVSIYDTADTIQFKYGKNFVPASPVDIVNNYGTNQHMLETRFVYPEYVNVCQNNDPAIPADIYSKTVPLFVFAHSDVNKLESPASLSVLLPGSNASSSTTTKQMKMFHGEMKTYEISAAGICSEIQSSI